jgi:hypothetical protein
LTSQNRWTLAGLVVGAGFLWIALRQISVGQALGVLRGASWPLVLATGVAGAAFMYLKGARWALLLGPVARVETRLLHRVLYVGAAANLGLAHSGEVLRATLLARHAGAGASAVLATIAVERIFDFAALAVLAALAIAIDPHVSPQLSVAGGIALAIVLAGVLSAWLLLRASPAMVRLGSSLLDHLPAAARDWLIDQLRRGRVGLEPLIDPSLAARAGLLSVLQWACIVAAIWTSSAAVGSTPPLTGALAAFVLMVIGLTLPAPPAQLGTTQLAFVVGLGLVGIDPESAVAGSLIYTGLVVLPVMLIGGWLGLLTPWPAAASRAQDR